jgi:hypothetical protein
MPFTAFQDESLIGREESLIIDLETHPKHLVVASGK